MPLNMEYMVQSTGATSTYHVVTQISVDFETHRTVATVASYVSKDARDAGKYALFTQPVMFDGEPPADQGLCAFAETQLSATAPTDGTPAAYPNRYVFAGAAIVA